MSSPSPVLTSLCAIRHPWTRISHRVADIPPL